MIVLLVLLMLPLTTYTTIRMAGFKSTVTDNVSGTWWVLLLYSNRYSSHSIEC